jgi:hypothetical protein
MLRVEEIAYDDFVSVWAGEPADRVAEFLAGAPAGRVVIRHEVAGKILYYVRGTRDVIAACRSHVGRTLVQALELHESGGVPLVAADDSAETSPDVCVIQRDGELVGYYDVTVPVNAVRSGLRSGSDAGALEATARESASSVRNVYADFPDSVAEGETVSLLVSLRRTSAGGTEVPVVLAGGKVDVVVRPRKGFALVGAGEREVLVTDGEESLRIQFKLRGTAVGPGRVEVVCLQGGTTLGSVMVYATVLPPSAPTSGQSAEVTGPLAPPPAAEADLVFLIRDFVEGQTRRLEYTLKAADPAVEVYFKRYYSPTFEVEPDAYFQNFYRLLDVRLQEAGGADASAQLAAYGAALFDDLIPDDLQTLLWALRDRIKTVHVLSDEAWVPWELVKLTGPDGAGGFADGPFLCQAFRLTRWFPGVGRRPRLRLRKLAVVAPAGTGLPNAEPERDYLLGLADPNRREVTALPTAKEQLLAELQKGEYDGLHFVGHGMAEPAKWDESSLDLGGNRALRVNDLAGRVVRNCVRSVPLVFLNACQSGQGGLGLTGIGGWARKFIRAGLDSQGREIGAAAFVGTLWSVRDGSAKTFASGFYDRLLAGMTVSDAAFEARKAAGPTGLAYTVFADPFAKVSELSPAPASP